MLTSTKVWRAVWGDHEIVVENRIEWLLLSSRERLFIDGELVTQRRTRNGLRSLLWGEIRDDQAVHEVFARLGSYGWRFRTGCKIYVDGRAVGGDIGKMFW